MVTEQIWVRSKIHKFRQVKYKHQGNWLYQMYAKMTFEREGALGEQPEIVKHVEGFSKTTFNVDAGVLVTMRNECIAYAQGTLGGSNWHYVKWEYGYVIHWRKLARGRKITEINYDKWIPKRRPKPRRTRRT